MKPYQAETSAIIKRIAIAFPPLSGKTRAMLYALHGLAVRFEETRVGHWLATLTDAILSPEVYSLRKNSRQ